MHATDAKILNNIINSTTVPAKNDLLNKWQSEGKDVEDFPATRSVVIDGLSKRITQILSYKVSQEAYQRYSVRLHVIETLRDWSKLKGDIGKALVFQDSEKSHAFLVHLLKKYMKPKHLSMCSDMEHLIQVGEVLLNAIERSRSLMYCFVKVIERIISLEQTEKSEQFLIRVIDNSDDLRLELSLVEKIFASLKVQFIEKPLTDCFVACCMDKHRKELQLSSMSMFFKKVIDSPLLFSIMANSLRELFVETKFAKAAQDFIKKVLEKIQSQCDEYRKDILELYPASLQHCVLLLRIKPIDHTKKSQSRAVQSLQEIFFKDYNDALMLVSHFPDWLPQYLDFSRDVDEVIEKSDAC
ncbi:hypothetical protein TSAR_003749 [Trichomalopsis sarcophagae]|uniref:Uncharacterized protein n=1 Tax=Trichomalopsis sarcophagae TaxID=543379 RepID=A0A232FB56_9HYME|nr:hypothetical protein TSAR_003749 [Trichomalopsis sarcophagae]